MIVFTDFFDLREGIVGCVAEIFQEAVKIPADVDDLVVCLESLPRCLILHSKKFGSSYLVILKFLFLKIVINIQESS